VDIRDDDDVVGGSVSSCVMMMTPIRHKTKAREKDLASHPVSQRKESDV
jgi:hypothetical protein